MEEQTSLSRKQQVCAWTVLNQRAVLTRSQVPMLEPNKVRNEMKALQKHFRSKRNFVIGRLLEMGFKISQVPECTFYIWLDLSSLPQAINDGLNFFYQCLQEKVIGTCGPSSTRKPFDCGQSSPVYSSI